MKLFKNSLFVTVILLLTICILPGFNCSNESDVEESKTSHSRDLEIRKVKRFLGDDALVFFILGDWGRNGNLEQKKVAASMAMWGDYLNPDFIISTGDNFYCCGVSSVSDPLWKSNFENVYHQKSLKTYWYPVLGNHDYMGNPQAQVDYTSKHSRWKMLNRYYSIVKTTNDGERIRFIFLDTNPFVDKYRRRTDHGDIGLMDTSRQLNWLDSTLKVSVKNNEQVVVTGHHPIYSSGTGHGSTLELHDNVKVMFDKYKVKIYLAGHEHDLQHQKKQGETTHYLVSGGGSEIRPAGKIEGITRYAKGNLGYLILAYKNETWNTWFIDENGDILYRTDFK
jgi:tartrate-resistant acid phosphatase type 5